MILETVAIAAGIVSNIISVTCLVLARRQYAETVRNYHVIIRLWESSQYGKGMSPRAAAAIADFVLADAEARGDRG